MGRGQSRLIKTEIQPTRAPSVLISDDPAPSVYWGRKVEIIEMGERFMVLSPRLLESGRFFAFFDQIEEAIAFRRQLQDT